MTVYIIDQTVVKLITYFSALPELVWSKFLTVAHVDIVRTYSNNFIITILKTLNNYFNT